MLSAMVQFMAPKHDDWCGIHRETGGILLGVLLVVSMLTLLGLFSVKMAAEEIQSVSATQQEMSARYLAESGVDVVMRWFHDPLSHSSGAIRRSTKKRHVLPRYGPSFFNTQGHSQFSGSAQQPDLVFDASQPSHVALFHDPQAGWFRSIPGGGRVQSMKLFGPTRPGLLTTVEIHAKQGGISRIQSVQLGASAVPPLSAAAMILNQWGGAPLPNVNALPLEVHWGDLRIKGDAKLGFPYHIPVKSSLASVNGLSYSQMGSPEDRWVDIFIGGNVLNGTPNGSRGATVLNLYVNQDPVPGVPVDAWDYGRMKSIAQREGTYYVLGHDGLLYEPTSRTPGIGIPANAVFGSTGLGDHRGLVFIDTVDQQPPGPHNLGTLRLTADYAEGLFVINAHVDWTPAGAGKDPSVLSPPVSGVTSARVPVRLSSIHLQGVLAVAGDLRVSRNTNMFGALIVGGTVRSTTPSMGALEIWFDHDVSEGLFRGVPVVYVAPGTWKEVF